MNTILKLWKIFSKKEKYIFIFLIFGSFIGMLLEVLSLGSIIPAISLLLDGNLTSIETYSFLNLENILSVYSKENIIIFGLAIVFIFFLIKNIYLILLVYLQNKFGHIFVSSIQSKIYKTYIKNDYNFHINSNTAILLRNITTECSRLLNSILQILILFTELIILIGIIFLVLFINFTTSLIAGSFLIFFVIFYQLLLNKKILSFGEQRLNIAGQINKNVLQSLSSIKEIKILSKEHFFIKILNKKVLKVANINIIYKTLLNIPRSILELVALSGIILLIYTLLNLGKNNIQIIELIGFYAVIAYRTIPGVSKLLSASQNLKFDSPSIDVIIEILKEDSKSNKDKSNPSILNNLRGKSFKIELKELFFSFDKNKIILNNINLLIEKGDYIGILGPSGSGKSTLLNVIMGILKQTRGNIRVFDNKNEYRISDYQKLIGYVPQNIYLMDDTIENNIAFGEDVNEIDRDKIYQLIDKLNLTEFIKSLPLGIKSNIGERGVKISGGQLQRISIARALYRDPEILILDEATSSLDETNEIKIIDSLQTIANKKTIIFVSHRKNALSYCNKILNIFNGKITDNKKIYFNNESKDN